MRSVNRPFLFEIAWEVANKGRWVVGHSVISSWILTTRFILTLLSLLTPPLLLLTFCCFNFPLY